MLTTPPALPAHAAELLARVRRRAPRIHCITNTVAQAFTANMLLAAGALPSMTITTEEIGDFIARADGLLVNLGTLDADRREAIGIALDIAAEARLSWLLDPVFVDRSRPRAAFARALLAQRPRAVRLNRAEFAALADAFDDEHAAVTGFSLDHLAVVGLTGEVDLVSDGVRFAEVANGHPMMARVTAMGCAGAALNAAFLAVEEDPFVATAAALLVTGVAGEVAGAIAQGPGSFAAAFLDAVHALDADTLTARAKVSL